MGKAWDLFERFWKNEFFRGGLVLLVLINIGNFLSYVFQFFMARMLGPADYGVLAVITSITYIFGVPTYSVQTVVSKWTTGLKIENKYSELKGVFNAFIKKSLWMATIIFIIYIPIAYVMHQTLGISFWLLILTGTFLYGGFLYPIGTGVLQGMKKFKVWGWNFIINNLARLVLAVVLVFIGFSLYGPVAGLILSNIVGFVFIFPYIKEIIKAKEIKEKVQIFSRERTAAFISMLIIVFMYSIDMIMVKAFFPADIAGKYAVLSMIGKVILFGSITIGNAMFPISSEKFHNGDKSKTRGVMWRTHILTLMFCFIVLFLFLFFPSPVIKILFGSQYVSFTSSLIYIGVAFSAISFLNNHILYRISVNELKINHIFILLIFLIIQVAAMILFNSSIKMISMAFMWSTIISFIGSVIFIRIWKKQA